MESTVAEKEIQLCTAYPTRILPLLFGARPINGALACVNVSNNLIRTLGAKPANIDAYTHKQRIVCCFSTCYCRCPQSPAFFEIVDRTFA